MTFKVLNSKKKTKKNGNAVMLPPVKSSYSKIVCAFVINVDLPSPRTFDDAFSSTTANYIGTNGMFTVCVCLEVRFCSPKMMETVSSYHNAPGGALSLGYRHPWNAVTLFSPAV